MTSVIAEKLSRSIAFICAAILYVTFGAIFSILCTDVVLRYFSGSSLRWASEIPELLFPWLVMTGYGASGPAGELYEHFGITPAAIVAEAKRCLQIRR